MTLVLPGRVLVRPDFPPWIVVTAPGILVGPTSTVSTLPFGSVITMPVPQTGDSVGDELEVVELGLCTTATTVTVAVEFEVIVTVLAGSLVVTVESTPVVTVLAGRSNPGMKPGITPGVLVNVVAGIVTAGTAVELRGVGEDDIVPTVDSGATLIVLVVAGAGITTAGVSEDAGGAEDIVPSPVVDSGAHVALVIDIGGECTAALEFAELAAGTNVPLSVDTLLAPVGLSGDDPFDGNRTKGKKPAVPSAAVFFPVAEAPDD